MRLRRQAQSLAGYPVDFPSARLKKLSFTEDSFTSGQPVF